MNLQDHVAYLYIPCFCFGAEQAASTCQDILGRIGRKQFGGNQSETAKELNFALKTAAKLVKSHKQVLLEP